MGRGRRGEGWGGVRRRKRGEVIVVLRVRLYVRIIHNDEFCMSLDTLHVVKTYTCVFLVCARD